VIGLILDFCPGKQVFHGKEHYNDKSNDFGDEIIRETGYVGIPEHNKEIIKPVVRGAPGKTPSQQRPEENFRLSPHIVFQEVEERSTGHQKNACIPAAPVMIISQKSEDKGECKGMGNKATAGKRIRKEYPAKELIDNIRQERTQGYIQIVYPAADSGYKILEDEKQSKCNAEVTEKEHDVFKGLYESK